MDNRSFTNMLKNEYKVVAVMSGTSLDGIDLLYASFRYSEDWTFEILACETQPYDSEWKKILRHLTEKSVDELLQIDDDYSVYLAREISTFIRSNGITNIDFIASHGHTALHRPEDELTLQIGNQQVLANSLGRKVICDFRVQDVNLGGQGAPLVPIGDRLLFSDYTCCLNLGGFANVSFEVGGNRVAYDICPVNIVLNAYAKQLGFAYDNRGNIARQGELHQSLLQQLNALSYYTETPPKSLGLEWVKTNIFPLIDSFKLSIADILRTFTEHVAAQISKGFQSNASVLVTGGGAYNTFLMERIQQLSTSKLIIPSKDIVEFKEALIFGLLGVLKERNAINILSSVTGASKDHSSGKVLLPEN